MKTKVLIVEDEFIVSNDLRIVLQRADYHITGLAASAEEALDSIGKHKPDIVLLDIRLDGKLSGIDLARNLKEGGIAFVYLSANSNQKILEEAKATEPDGFLVKPFREKDLLVTLDIAYYRHKHSLESKLRQADFLQNQLAKISNEISNEEQKLLRIARAMQSYIPFDFFAAGLRPLTGETLSDTGFFRIGFDEYQLIREKELLTITGLTNADIIPLIKKSHVDTHAMIYDNGISKEKPGTTSLLKLFFDSFDLRSCIVFPVVMNNGQLIHYSFYNRREDIYTMHHINLLNRLKMNFADIADKFIQPELSTALPVYQPKSVNTKYEEPHAYPVFKTIIGKHPLLLDALDQTVRIAPYTTSVLILGESGTGKEKVAESIHVLSPRKNKPFIKVNCAAIPATLIESELFGHEKGAFTGAIEKRKGKFEQADGGTLFLDEIGELLPEMQVKLLRVLQEKEIEPLGGNSSVKVDVRIVAATNRNLEKEVAEGKFRLDLYYRINVFPITLPPLRERKTDIAALALHFANKFSEEYSKPFMGISISMMEELLAYNWPGNIRELENVLEQSVVLNDGQSKLELRKNLTSAATGGPGTINIKTLEDVKYVQRETEREYIVSILRKTKGRIRGANGAAEILNLKPTTLEAKMTRLNIKKKDFIDSTEN